MILINGKELETFNDLEVLILKIDGTGHSVRSLSDGIVKKLVGMEIMMPMAIKLDIKGISDI